MRGKSEAELEDELVSLTAERNRWAARVRELEGRLDAIRAVTERSPVASAPASLAPVPRRSLGPEAGLWPSVHPADAAAAYESKRVVRRFLEPATGPFIIRTGRGSVFLGASLFSGRDMLLHTSQIAVYVLAPTVPVEMARLEVTIARTEQPVSVDLFACEYIASIVMNESVELHVFGRELDEDSQEAEA